MKTAIHRSLFAALFLLLADSFAKPPGGTWDVYDHGAKGDGSTLDTAAIQAAIDACHAAGGGRVYLHNGRFRSGTLRFKSNVILHVEAGALLLASTRLEDFPTTSSRHPSYTGEFITGKMFLHAEDARGIGIEGRGTIDGGGDAWAEGPYGFPSFHFRPRLLHFVGCENVQIRGVTFRNSASWTLSFLECRDMVLDGLRIESRENPDIEAPRYAVVRGRNNDGIDLVDCQAVRVSNCFINSGDDAIVLKSFSPDGLCRDITITNCVVSSNASGIKIGTESAGAFEDIVVQNCTVYDTRCEGLAVLTVDGARIERVSFSNISLRNIKGDAILVRLGARDRTYRKDATAKKGGLKDVMFSQIQGTRISELGNAIVGVPGQLIENVVLRDINIEFTGGGPPEAATRTVPENVKGYPGVAMFGKHLPAYGFFVRHARNVVFDNVRLSFAADDHRPAIVCDNVDGLTLKRIQARVLPGIEPVRLVRTRNVEHTPAASIAPRSTSSPGFMLGGRVRIATSSDALPVSLAARDLAADFERVLGTPPEIGTSAAEGDRADISLAIDPALVDPEAWRVVVSDRGVQITGSDALGLVYGVYNFSERCLGVDPLWFWKGIRPERRDTLSLEPQTFASTPAKFRYRGWFINDEDLLTEFGTSNGPRHIDYPFYAQVIDPRMAERIFEALLRLGGNLIIPASFVDVMNEPEADLVRRAAARGLYVSQHHVEPMGVSHFGFENFWRARGEKKSFRYSSDPDAVRTVWRASAQKWRELAGDQVVWQLGMRGRGDRPIWIDDKAITRETGGDFISRAMADQAAIVRSVDPRPNPPMTTTLFLEGADLMASGELRFPPGITVVFADHGPSQEMQNDFHTAPRLPEYRYGAYYHVAFWRRGPHLVQGVSAQRIHRIFEQLESRDDTHYAIVNVSNIREHVLGAHTFIRTAVHGAQRPLEKTLDEFAPAATRPFMDAFHAALLRRPDGVWQQDGDCVEAAEVYLRAKTRADGTAAARRLIDPDATERAAAKLEQVGSAGVLEAVSGRWRGWTRDYFIVQAEYLAALYRAVAALARDEPAEAARHIARSLEIRAPLATGQWEGWYVGDKKANWPGILQRLEQVSRKTPTREKS